MHADALKLMLGQRNEGGQLTQGVTTPIKSHLDAHHIFTTGARGCQDLEGNCQLRRRPCHSSGRCSGGHCGYHRYLIKLLVGSTLVSAMYGWSSELGLYETYTSAHPFHTLVTGLLGVATGWVTWAILARTCGSAIILTNRFTQSFEMSHFPN